jgi:hypothetical protein
MYSSACFGRPHPHHQELNNCSSSLWFYRWCVVVAGRPDHDQQHCYHHAPTVKPEAATAVIELLMMGMRMPETCWAVSKRQVINLWSCCILLVDSVEIKWILWNRYLFKYTVPQLLTEQFKFISDLKTISNSNINESCYQPNSVYFINFKTFCKVCELRRICD